MYLIIFEDGAMWQMEELEEGIFDGYHEELLDIVVHDEEGFKKYVNGEFELIKSR